MSYQYDRDNPRKRETEGSPIHDAMIADAVPPASPEPRSPEAAESKPVAYGDPHVSAPHETEALSAAAPSNNVHDDAPTGPAVSRGTFVEPAQDAPRTTFAESTDSDDSQAANSTGDEAAATPPTPSDDELWALADGVHTGPHSILGQHPWAGGTIIRALRPMADEVTAVLASGTRVPLEHIGHGVWQGNHEGDLDDYQIESRYGDSVWTADDPYRFMPSFGEVDSYLFGEGRHEKLWHVLGSHTRMHRGTHEDTFGTSFAVWAPHARAVQVIGNFNGWDGRAHAMRRIDSNGVWELFIPGLGADNVYKFRILTQDGRWIEKADPMARHAECPPGTASVVTESHYEWHDEAWMEKREQTDPHNSPQSVYEVHFGSWRPGLTYREAADQLIDYVTEMGFTHIEFLPLAEHPFGGSWGYQVTGYYAPTSRYGHPDDLRYLIDRLHQANIGVILDWVPGHFPKDAFALAQFDGQALYEHPDPRRGEQLDWGTYVFNFGDSQVRNFLVANALYWLEEFHIDALRVDAVASMLYLDYSREEWLPNEFGGRENLEAISFLQETTATAYRKYPGTMMIAEESTSWPGVTRPTSSDGLGFGLKWNMGWMNDTLRYIERDPMYRSWHHGELTFSFVYAWSENFILPISHDEVVHGKGSLIEKMPGDPWQKLANVRVFLAYMWAHPGKQLLFMGQEFGQWAEWSESRGLDWWTLDQPANQGLQRLVKQLNKLYVENPALWKLDNDSSGFEFIEGGDAQNSTLSFVRTDRDGNELVCVTNFSGQPVNNYRLGFPATGRWREVLNTDAEEFGGSGVGNFGGVDATDEEPMHGRPASATITVPPLGAVWFVRDEPRESIEQP